MSAHPDEKKYSKVLGKTADLMRLLEEGGVGYGHLQLPINHPEIRDRLVAFWRRAGFPFAQGEEMWRKTDTKKVIGFEEAHDFTGLLPPEDQGVPDIQFDSNPCPKWVTDYRLVLVPPISIAGMLKKAGHEMATGSVSLDHEVMRERSDDWQWHFLLRDRFPGSVGLSYKNSTTNVFKFDPTKCLNVASARVVAYVALYELHFRENTIFQNAVFARSRGRKNPLVVEMNNDDKLLIRETDEDKQFLDVGLGMDFF